MNPWRKCSGHYFAAGKQRGALKFCFAFQKKDMPIGVLQLQDLILPL